MKTNKPLYFTLDYKLTFADNDLPTHYAFKVGNNLDAIAREYEQVDVKKISVQLSTLIAKVDTLQNTLSPEFTSSIPKGRAHVRLSKAFKRTAQQKPVGPVSVGGAPLTIALFGEEEKGAVLSVVQYRDADRSADRAAKLVPLERSERNAVTVIGPRVRFEFAIAEELE